MGAGVQHDDEPHRHQDGLTWRTLIRQRATRVTLVEILNDLWVRGIPVVSLDVLPAPSFQGLACIVEGRPVILVSYKHDEPGRVAFWIAHEAGHIASGDCAPEHPVVDADDEIGDESNIERNADLYATQALVGAPEIPRLPVPDSVDFKMLARQAIEAERNTGADASAVIYAWARRTGDYALATMAVKALYRGTGARRELLRNFLRHVDIDAAADTDRSLLRCVQDNSTRDEAAR